MKSIVEITTPAASFDMTVLATARVEVGIDASDSSKDALLRPYIQQASDAAATYCKRVFAEETVTQTFWPYPSGQCVNCLILDRAPVSAIASVTLDDDLIDSDEYRLDAAAGLLYRLDSNGYPSSWSFSKSLIVAYTGGYALLDDLPFGIERAVLITIKEYWAARARDPRLKGEDVPGVASLQYWVGDTGGEAGLPPEAVALLDPHRRMIVA